MSLASNYARALFETLPESDRNPKVFEKLGVELDQFISLLNASKELRVALYSGITSGSEKALIVEELNKQLKTSDLMSNFLILLARKGRVNALSAIRSSLREVRLQATGGIMGRVASADELSPAELDSLADAFSTKLGRTIEFETSVDPSLLAGLQVTVNGVTYDGTLKTQLEELREKFMGASQEVH